MKKFLVDCQLCFDTKIEVAAKNEEEAIDIVRRNFRATIGNVSDNQCDNIKDYSVDCHGYPENIEAEWDNGLDIYTNK